MLVIGLTGGIGSGKSTVADLFQRKGIDIVDADQLSREVVEPGKPALQTIAAHFGNEILNEQGGLRRKLLREKVFADPAERHWLEQLLHPLINTLIRERIAACSSAYCILMSPLLLETRQKDMVNRILVVDVSRETQLTRTMRRDNSPRETIEAIIDTQVSRQTRLAAADDLIDNDGQPGELENQVDRLHDSYLSLSINGKQPQREK